MTLYLSVNGNKQLSFWPYWRTNVKAKRSSKLALDGNVILVESTESLDYPLNPLKLFPSTSKYLISWNFGNKWFSSLVLCVGLIGEFNLLLTETCCFAFHMLGHLNFGTNLPLLVFQYVFIRKTGILELHDFRCIIPRFIAWFAVLLLDPTTGSSKSIGLLLTPKSQLKETKKLP